MPLASDLPDLAVTEVIAPSSAGAGESINLTWYVENRGESEVTTRVIDAVYLSTDEQWDDSDVLVTESQSYFSFPLPAGVRYKQSVSARLPEAAPDSKYLIFVTDSNAELTEQDEQNNVRAVPVTISIPDLVVAHATATADGYEFRVEWTLENLGGTTTSSWHDSIYLSMDEVWDDQDQKLADTSRSASPIGMSKRWVDVTTSIAQAGNYYLLVVADSAHEIGELVETNNVWSVPIEVTLPDFVVSDASTPDRARLGEEFQVVWHVTDHDQVEFEGGTETAIFLSVDATLDSADLLVHSAKYYGSYKYGMKENIELVQANIGPAFLLFVVNGKLSQRETDESNNVLAKPIEIEALPLELSAFQAPADIYYGRATEVSWEMSNQGATAFDDPSRLRLYLSVDDTLDDADELVRTISKLPPGPGASEPHKFEFYYFGKRTGHQYLLLSAGAYAENEEVLSQPVNVYGWPVSDLALVMASAPTTATTSEVIPYSWTIRNQGAGKKIVPAPVAYLSDDPTFDPETDHLIEGTNRPNRYRELLPGEEYSGTITDLLRLPDNYRGDFFLFFVAHFGGDSDLTNNVLAQPISITGPDLKLMGVEVPHQGAVREGLDLVWTVKNAGTVPTLADWKSALYFSKDDQLDARDIRLGLSQVAEKSVLQAGQDTRNSARFVLPSEAAGDYYLLMVADFDQKQGETDELNNLLAVPFTLQAPDLIVTGIEAPDVADPGEKIRVKYTVKNIGEVTALVPRFDSISLSQDGKIPTYSTLVSVAQTKAVEPGASYVGEVEIVVPGYIAGNHFILLRADKDYSQVETNEDNNVETAPLLVRGPDLIISSEELPATVSLRESLNVQWRISNIGTHATRFEVRSGLYLSADEYLDDQDFKISEHKHEQQLEASDSILVSATAFIPDFARSSKYLLLVADKDRYIPETNETNNVQAIPVAVSGADLELTSVTAPAKVTAGETITLVVNAMNGGQSLIEGSWRDSVYLSKQPLTNGSFTNIVSQHQIATRIVDSDEGYSSSLELKIPTNTNPGEYFLIFRINDNNVVPEIDLLNNSRSVPLIIEAPDLKVSNVTAPTSAYVGATLDISWTVSNQGNVSALAGWEDRFYISTDEVLDSSDVPIGSKPHSSQNVLNASASYTETARVTLPHQIVGAAYLIVRTDGNQDLSSYGTQAEVDEQNNSFAAQIQIDAPDLVISDVRAPNTAVLGENITLSWTVKNIGDFPAAGIWRNNVYISQDEHLDSEDIPLSSEERPTILAAQGESELAVAVQVPHKAPFGDLFLLVTTAEKHPLSRQGETNKDNNLVSVPIRVNAPDLTVMDVSAPASSRNLSDITISWTVTNRNAATASGQWYDSVYLSADPVLDSRDTRLGLYERMNWVSSGEGSEQYHRTESIHLPAIGNGMHFLLVTVNDSRHLPKMTETDLANNIYATPIKIFAPDLVVTSLTVPDPLPTIGEVEISWTVENHGDTAVTGDWKDQLTISKDDMSENRHILSTTPNRPSGLVPGESYNRTITVPVSVLEGTGTVLLEIDIANQVGDVQRDNNKGIAQVQFIKLPINLRLGTYQVPAVIAAGQATQISWETQNSGAGYIGKTWWESAWFSADDILDASDQSLATVTVNWTKPAIPDTFSQSAEFNVPSEVQGPAYILFVLDDLNYISESNEEDNFLAVPILVTAAARPWQNPIEATDVTGDGRTIPIDALVVFNEINDRRLSDPLTSKITAARNHTSLLLDVTGDGYVTPADALAVINQLNHSSEAGPMAGSEPPVVLPVPAAIPSSLLATSAKSHRTFLSGPVPAIYQLYEAPITQPTNDSELSEIQTSNASRDLAVDLLIAEWDFPATTLLFD